MYINMEKRAVYLANPRTASTATRELLVRQYGFLGVNALNPDDLPFTIDACHSPHHYRIKAWKPFQDDRRLWTIATTVRHHFQVVASWAFHADWWTCMDPATNGEPKQVRKVTPELLDYIYNQGGRYYPDPDRLFPHTKWADRWLRYDNIEGGLHRWLTFAGIPCESVVLQQLGGNHRNGTPWQKVLDEKMRDAICERYAQEMKELAYRRGEVGR